MLLAENVGKEDEGSYKVVRLDFDGRTNAIIKIPQQLLQARANGIANKSIIIMYTSDNAYNTSNYNCLFYVLLAIYHLQYDIIPTHYVENGAVSVVSVLFRSLQTILPTDL